MTRPAAATENATGTQFQEKVILAEVPSASQRPNSASSIPQQMNCWACKQGLGQMACNLSLLLSGHGSLQHAVNSARDTCRSCPGSAAINWHRAPSASTFVQVRPFESLPFCHADCPSLPGIEPQFTPHATHKHALMKCHCSLLV